MSSIPTTLARLSCLLALVWQIGCADSVSHVQNNESSGDATVAPGESTVAMGAASFAADSCNDCGSPDEAVTACTLASHGGTVAIVEGLDTIDAAKELGEQIACPSASTSQIYYMRVQVLAVAAGKALPETLWMATYDWFGPGDTRLVTLKSVDGIWAALANIPVELQSDEPNEPPYELANDFESLSEEVQASLADFSSSCPNLEQLDDDQFRQRAIGECRPTEDPLERFHPDDPALCDRLVDHFVFSCDWSPSQAYELGERCDYERQEFARQKQHNYIQCLSESETSCEPPEHRFKACDPRLRPACQTFVEYEIVTCGEDETIAQSNGDLCQNKTENLGAEETTTYVECLKAHECDAISSNWDNCL